MIGNLVNAIGILIGGFFGLLVGKKLKKETSDNLLKVIGACILVIGLGGVLSYLLIISKNDNDTYNISTNYELELLIFLSLGTIFGHLLKIDDGINKLGDLVEKKLKKDGFSRGFVSASLVFCIGAMAVIGSVNASVLHDNTVLYTKALIDTITAFIMASSLGFGVMFSSLAVFLYQLLFYLMGLGLSSFLNQDANPEFFSVFCVVGYTIVACIGINFILGDDFKKIKIANMLPSIILVIIYYLLKFYIF